MSTANFYFRIWFHPDDVPEIETWFQGLECDRCHNVSNWVQSSFSEEDFEKLFDLDISKHWQIVGTAKIRGSHDYYGEYDEEIDIIEFSKQEVSEDNAINRSIIDLLGYQPPDIDMLMSEIESLEIVDSRLIIKRKRDT